MSGGLNDGNWSIRLEQQRKRIRELEGKFLSPKNLSPSYKLDIPRQIHNLLVDYLEMKKGSDSWGQKRREMYAGYIQGEIAKEELLKYIQENQIPSRTF